MRVIKLFRINDGKIESKVAYVEFARICLDIGGGLPYIFKHDDGMWMYLIEITGSEKVAEAIKEAEKKIKGDDIIDFTPDEDRLKIFNAFFGSKTKI